MLTQCPECKTTFHLHLKQLKAADGKVRCSRCHTTFDALDNLFATPAQAEQQTPTPEVPPEEHIAPDPISIEEIASTTDVEPEVESTSLAEPKIALPTAEIKEDTLNAFINELEESTANSNDITMAADEPEEYNSPANSDVLSTAFNAIDNISSIEAVEEETLDLVEPEELVEEPFDTFEESFNIKPVEDESLPLVELEELVEEPSDTFEESFSIEPAEDETLELVEPEDLVEEPSDTFEEVFSIEPAEEETLPLIETKELPEESLDTFEEAFSIEPVEEETLPLNSTGAGAESMASDEELNSFFEEADTEATEELSSEIAPLINDDELNNLFEEDEPEIEAATDELEDNLDTFFEATVSDEPTTVPEQPGVIEEQGDLLEGLDEKPENSVIDKPQGEPDEETTMDEFPLPEEPQESGPTESSIDSLAPSSEEPTAEDGTTQEPIQHTDDELEPDTSDEPAEQPAIEETPVAAKTNGYAIPAELTQARQSSGTASIMWGLGIVLMCVVLLLQYLYYFRLQLVDNPQLRPLLTTICDVTNCELPPRRDLEQIELAEHRMQFHPNYKRSLLITATLANRADFAQPYPLVEVLMTNIDQQVVARRHFTPEQYLPNHSGSSSFPADSEVPLMLEVLDPGNDAVGFEFRFY
ncbi:MAG: DUF3426 domain-containing protein [Pseudomonadota bacterium]